MFVAEVRGELVRAQTLRELYLKIKDHLDGSMCDYVSDYERRVVARVSYADNLICHFLVSYGLNYRCGYPSNLLFYDERFRSVKKLTPFWWHIAAAIVGAGVRDFDEMMSLLEEIKRYVVEGGARPHSIARLKGVMEPEDVKSIRDVLSDELKECWESLMRALSYHHSFYRNHWKRVHQFIREIAMRQERVCNGARVVEFIEEVTGISLPSQIIISTVEVFREGGGIFGVRTKDGSLATITMPCSKKFTLLCVDTLVHELSHIPVEEILKKRGLSRVVSTLLEGTPRIPEWVIEYIINELATVALEVIVVSCLISEDAVIHGWAKTISVKSILNAFDRDFSHAVSHWLDELVENEKLKNEVLRLASEMAERSQRGWLHLSRS